MSSSKNFHVDVQTADDVFAPSIMSPCASSLWNLLTPKSNRAPGLPPASPKRNRPIDFDEDEDELRRPPSLYVHNPYGAGQMLRLKPFHEIVAELQAQAAAAAAALQAEQAANTNNISLNNKSSNIAKVPEVEVTKTEDNEDEDEDNHSQDESGSPLTCPSSNNKQSANGKRRRRQKKPRKNRSASLEGENGERVSVCLDYLKGVCNRKRSRCKFAHPPLAFTTAVPTTRVPCTCTPSPNTACECPTPQVNVVGLIPTIPVCAGWAMMGYCSHGPMCAEAHPQANMSYQPVGAPVYPSSWMGMEVSRAARRASNVSAGSMWSDSSEEGGYYRTPSPSSFDAMPTNHLQYPQPQPAVAFPPTFLRAWREVNAWLGATAFQNFDYTLAHVFNVLYDPASGVTLERLLPAIFGKAIDNCERLARVLAALCERLCALLSEEEQEQMKMQMSRLANTVLQFVPEGTETDEQIISMARKQRGTAAFLGELFLQGLITPACLQSHLEYITQRAMEPSDVGALYTELGCVVLNVAGHVASSRLPVDQIVQSLNASVSFHQAHRQGMVAGTMNVQSTIRML